jgi:hypothetical protein
MSVKVITKLPNSEQSYKGKVQTHNKTEKPYNLEHYTLSFGDKFIWLLNSESKDTLICMCDFLLKSHCFG